MMAKECAKYFHVYFYDGKLRGDEWNWFFALTNLTSWSWVYHQSVPWWENMPFGSLKGQNQERYELLKSEIIMGQFSSKPFLSSTNRDPIHHSSFFFFAASETSFLGFDKIVFTCLSSTNTTIGKPPTMIFLVLTIPSGG